MEFIKKGVAYAGLCDVVGGKMWHCIASTSDVTPVYFSYKKECEKYIRQNFTSDDKKFLLSQLRECKGRAFILN